MLPEPVLIDKCIPVSHHDIINRVQLQDLIQKRIMNQLVFRYPHDRCQPDPDLKRNADHLRQIPEKNYHSARQIRKPKDKQKQSRQIVQQLQIIQIRKVSIAAVQKCNKHDKKQMYKNRRQNFHNRKHTDIEYDFFYQIAVLKQGICPAGQSVLKEEPGDNAGYQIQHKWDRK